LQLTVILLACNNTQPHVHWKTNAHKVLQLTVQDAQLSQRGRAAGCVIVFAKSRTLQLGDNHLRAL